MREPLISVIIPVYNTAEYLPCCLESVVQQSYSHLEVICINDGSTDDSLRIIEEWAALDNRIQLINTPNGGPGQARNLGLEQARGDYFIFLDSDDIYHPEMLSTLCRTAEREHADMVICRSVFFFNKDIDHVEEAPHTISPALLNKVDTAHSFCPAEAFGEDVFRFCVGWPWDKLIRRELIASHGLRYPILRNSEDGPFIYSCLALATRVCVCEQPFVKHRFHSTSVSRTLTKDAMACIHAVLFFWQEIEKHQRLRTDILRTAARRWSLEFLMWNVYNMPPDDGLSLIRNVHRHVEPVMQISAHTVEITNKQQLHQYRRLYEKGGFRCTSPIIGPLLKLEEQHSSNASVYTCLLFGIPTLGLCLAGEEYRWQIARKTLVARNRNTGRWRIGGTKVRK